MLIIQRIVVDIVVLVVVYSFERLPSHQEGLEEWMQRYVPMNSGDR